MDGVIGFAGTPFGSSGTPTEPKQGTFGPKCALLWPPEKRPDTRAKCVVTKSPAQAGRSGAVGTESGPPGPSEDLRGPRKDLLWPKRALFASF